LITVVEILICMDWHHLLPVNAIALG